MYTIIILDVYMIYSYIDLPDNDTDIQARICMGTVTLNILIRHCCHHYYNFVIGLYTYVSIHALGNCITFHFLHVGLICGRSRRLSPFPWWSYLRFRCLDLSMCIPVWGICDGYRECPDGSDESYSVCGKC